MSVECVRVGDVLSLQRRMVKVDFDGTYEEIGIRSFGRGVFHKEPVPGAALGMKRVFRIEPGDLLLSNVFAWEGAIAVAAEAERGKIGSHRFMTYTAVDNRIETAWASWFFRSEPGLELIRKASPGSAGRNRTLAIDRFEALQIPLPPIDEQRQVAVELDRVAFISSEVGLRRSRSREVASVLPLAVRTHLECATDRTPTRLGEVLELVQSPVSINPRKEYVSIGIRSFGKGLFHYPSRPGDRIGKLRFQSVVPELLAISNIKAWEGAVATTRAADGETVASNRFLFFRPRAGIAATDYFWALLLDSEGIAALGQASPGSADRNRTLAVDRFRRIELPIPGPDKQAELGRRIRSVRNSIAKLEENLVAIGRRSDALLPAAMNATFGDMV
jgi:type I restriction enzyme, S subunit